MLASNPLQSRTYRLERWRAVASGIIDTGPQTFLLLIAVVYFHAGNTAQSLVVTGGALGMVLSPLTIFYARRLGLPVTRTASLLLAIGALCVFIPVFFFALWIYVFGTMLAMTCISAAIPLFTQLYQDNYEAASRGKLFSRSTMIKVATGGLFSYGAGQLLNEDIAYARLVLLSLACCFLISSWLLFSCPSSRLHMEKGSFPFRSLRAVVEDRAFAWVLASWMLMGFGNLMMFPIRVKFLLEPRFGMEYPVMWVSIITGVIPALVHFLTSPLWGILFDRINFFLMRVILNLFFVAAVSFFFLGKSPVLIVLGSVFFGLAFGGGNVAWGLWVTKMTTGDKVADYMSTHTFFTGIRSFLAPALSVWLISYIPVTAVVGLSVLLILLASLMLIPELKSIRRRRSTTPLIEEICE
jgi:MFS family permease